MDACTVRRRLLAQMVAVVLVASLPVPALAGGATNQVGAPSGAGATSAAVDSSGSYRTSVSLELPAYHDIGPSLSLSYDSSVGNGPVGVGWTLMAGSTVVRASPGHGAPAYDAHDVYLLDGQPLLACGTQGLSASPSCDYKVTGQDGYTLAKESYHRISHLAANDTWHVWTTTGTELTFTARSHGTGKPVYAWDLATVRDTSGNQVTYSRVTGPSSPNGIGESYLESISYGPAAVTLRYIGRSDASSHGNGADLVETPQLLRSVEVRVAGSAVRAYQLDYDASQSTGQAVLKTVQEFGSDEVICTSASMGCPYASVTKGTSLPPTTVSTPSRSAGVGEWKDSSAPADTRIRPLPGLPYDNRNYPVTTPFPIHSSNSPMPRVRIADINGDGRDDVLELRNHMASDGLIHQFLSTAISGRTGFTYHDFDPDPSGVDQTLGISEDYWIGDWDGDGLDDLYQYLPFSIYDPTMSDRLEVWRSQGDGTFTRDVSRTISWPYHEQTYQCFTFAVGVGVTFGFYSAGASWPVYDNCDLNLDFRYMVGDINGDGRSDFFGVSQNPTDNTVTLHTAVANDTGFTVFSDVDTTDPWGSNNTRDDRFFPADVNGDGRLDLVHIGFHGNNMPGDPNPFAHMAITLAISTGTGAFTILPEQDAGAWDRDGSWQPGDVNGDGRTDLIHLKDVGSNKVAGFDHLGFDVFLASDPGGMLRQTSDEAAIPFFRQAPWGSLTKFPTPFLIGDIDGDGRADIAGVAEDNSSGTAHENLGVVFGRAGDMYESVPDYLTNIEPTAWNWGAPESVPVYLGDINGDHKHDVVFTPWRAAGTEYNLEIITHLAPNTALDVGHWRPLDVDGDGLQDYVYPYFRNPGYAIYTLRQIKPGQFDRTEDSVDLINMPGAVANLDNADTGRWLPADIGGGPNASADGRGDLVYVDHVPGNRLTVYSLISQGGGVWRHQAKTLPAPIGGPGIWEARDWLAADVNGDGRTDLVNLARSGSDLLVTTIVSNGDGDWKILAPATISGLPTVSPHNWQFGDVNGDGRADLIEVITSSGTVVHTLFLTDAGWNLVTGPTSAQSFGDGRRRWMTVEANGDGLTDLAYVDAMGSTLTVHTLLSIGNGKWRTEQPVDVTLKDLSIQDASAFRRADVNGDGRTDLLYVANTATSGNVTTEVLALVSQNSWWVQDKVDLAISSRDVLTWLSGDLDGDGRGDLTQLPDPADTAASDLSLLQIGAADDTVNRITSSLGGVTDVAYAGSTTWLSGHPASCGLPLGYTRTAVSEVHTSDGRSASPAAVTYAYSCPRWSFGQRGFLGWQEVSERRVGSASQPSSLAYNSYDITEECLSRPTQERVFDDLGHELAKTLTNYKPVNSAPPYRCLTNYVDTILLNGKSSAPNNYTYYTYDSFGNITSQYEQGDPGVGTDDRITVRTFHPATGPYVVSLPASEQMHAGPNTSAPVVRSRNLCYDGDTSLTCLGAPTAGRLTAVKELNLQGLADMAETRMAYDASGNLAAVRDPNGNVSQAFYDPTWHLFPTYFCDALMRCENVTWDPVADAPGTVIDINSHSTNYVYDVLGRLSTFTPAAGATLTRTYLDWGKPTQRVRDSIADGSPDGLWYESYVDGLGRTYQEVFEGGPSTGQVTKLTNYLGATELPVGTTQWYAAKQKPMWERVSYDELGRQVLQTHADGNKLSWRYDAAPDTTSVVRTDELGNQTTTFSDARGRVVRSRQVVNGFLADVQYGYTAADDLKTITDPAGYVTSYTVDNRGRVTTVQDPDRGTWQYTLDLVGNILTRTDARNLTVTYTYDALNRIRTRQDQAGRLVTFRYDESGHPDGLGRLTSVTDTSEPRCPGGVTYWYGYDPPGNATTVRQCVEGFSYEFDATYDGLGRQSTLTYPDHGVITNHYDSGGALSDIPGLIDATHYDAEGRLTGADFPNGTHLVNTIDPARGWLNNEKLSDASKTLYEAGYQHYKDGSISTSTSPTNAMNLGYTYDSMDRLSGVTGAQSQSMYYDLTGNITYNSEAGSYSYATAGSTTQCGLLTTAHPCPHAVADILGSSGADSFRYDADGNVTLATHTVGTTSTTRSFEWDADGLLTSMVDANNVTTTVRYDAFGRRVYRERAGQVTLYLDDLQEVSYPTAGGTVDTTKYYYAGSTRIASSKGSSVNWYTPDHVGSSRLLVDELGTTSARTDYGAFGTRVSGPAAAVGYTGAPTDTDAGLVYLGQRYYDPHLGRFLSPDPSTPVSASTQSINPYAYALNNPVSFVDPSGLQACAAAQESCMEAPPPQDTVVSFDPVTITGKYAPKQGIHVSCASCTLLDPPTEVDHTTVGELQEQGKLRDGRVHVMGPNTVTQDEPNPDQTGVQMYGGYAELGHAQANGLAWYDAAVSVATSVAAKGVGAGGGGGVGKGTPPGGGGGSAGGNQPTTVNLLRSIARRAENRIGGSGAVAGTLKHSYAKQLLDRYQRIFGNRGLETEVSYLNGARVPYATAGSVRLDVLEAGTNTIYDYKFVLNPPGLTAARSSRILSQMPGPYHLLEINP